MFSVDTSSQNLKQGFSVNRDLALCGKPTPRPCPRAAARPQVTLPRVPRAGDPLAQPLFLRLLPHGQLVPPMLAHMLCGAIGDRSPWVSECWWGLGVGAGILPHGHAPGTQAAVSWWRHPCGKRDSGSGQRGTRCGNWSSGSRRGSLSTSKKASSAQRCV